ncbi:MAG TPA: hypothetical protein VIJ38_17845 [Acidobacteriaceae bacterium]
MPILATGRDAKEFLVGRIVEESERVGVPLSEIERKMLYFSETGWTLPDIWEVNAAFDRDYDEVEYEEKIAGLIRGFRKNARQCSTAEFESWEAAVRLLRKEDHYLLVMVDMAATSSNMGWLMQESSDPNRFARLILIGAVGFVVCAVLLMAYMRLKS